MSPFFERLDGLNDEIRALRRLKERRAFGATLTRKANSVVERAALARSEATNALEVEFSQETLDNARKLLA
jgi:hypothetical protein